MSDDSTTHVRWPLTLLPFACVAVLLAAGCVNGRCTGGKTHDGLKPFGAVSNPAQQAFYKADGSFSAASAKQAYFDMMRAYAYPVPKVLETDQLWMCDFVQHDFAKLGMGGIFWINCKGQYGETGAKAYAGTFKDASYGYLGHEIYLLPGQMLPEHRHIGGSDGFGPKMEAWHVRHGSVQFFGEYKGDGGETPIGDMAASERPWGFGQDWFKSKYVVSRQAGELYRLDDPESWHFQRAGPQGAIVSEYATYHNQVEFSKPGMQFKCSEASASASPSSQSK